MLHRLLQGAYFHDEIFKVQLGEAGSYQDACHLLGDLNSHSDFDCFTFHAPMFKFRICYLNFFLALAVWEFEF